MNHEFQTPSPIKTEIRLASGTLGIVATDRTTTAVLVKPGDTSEAARKAAEEIIVEMRGDTLVVRAPDRGWLRFRYPKVDVRIELPNDSTLTVGSAAVDVDAHGRYADAVVNSASGDLVIDHVTGNATVKSASGDVKVNYVGGDTHASFASGGLRVLHAVGKVRVNAASGDIAIDRADSDVSATTASGDLTVGLASKGAVDLRTASGDIKVGVAAGTGVWLDLKTASGKTRSDLASTGDSAPTSGSTLTVKARAASGDIVVGRI